MQLENLVFQVDSTQVVQAAENLGKLALAIQDIEKPVNAFAGVAKSASKATEELAKDIPQALNDKPAGKIDRVTAALEKQQLVMKILRNQTLEFEDATVKVNQSFTAGQAGKLAALKMAGASADQFNDLVKMLTEFNDIAGINTFDKVTSGLSRLEKQTRETAQVQELMSRGYALSQKEIVDYARDLERLRQAHKDSGASAELAAKEEQDLLTRYQQASQALAQYAREAELVEKKRRQELEETMKVERQALELVEKVNNVRTATKQKEYQLAYMQAGVSESVANSAARKQVEGVPQEEINSYIRAAEAIRLHKEKLRELEKAKRDAANASKSNADAVEAEIQRTRRALEVEQEVANLMNQGVSRGTARFAAGLKSKGATEEQVKAYIAEAEALKKSENALNKVAKAKQYLADADARLAAALDESNQGFAERYTDRINKYSQQLKAAGYSAAESEKRLKRFRDELEKVAAKENTKRLDNLARGMSVQMGDVGVSLASGMNPLTVLIQQGDQIRGLIQQAGASSKELNKVMSTAAAQIATSFVDVGRAIGSFFVGAMKSAVMSVWEFATASAKLTWEGLKALKDGSGDLTSSLQSLWGATKLLGTQLMFIGGAAIGAALIGVIQLIRENDSLVRTLSLSGNSLQMNADAAKVYAQQMKDTGRTITDSLRVIEVFAEEGLGRKELDLFLQSAIDLEKYGKVKLEDVAKTISALKKDPVEALEKVMKSMGGVSSETLILVTNLKQQGKDAEAAAVAMKALDEANQIAISKMKSELSDFTKMWIDLKDILKETWDWYKRVTDRDSLSAQIAFAQENLDAKKSMPWFDQAQIDFAQEYLDKLIAQKKAIDAAAEAERARSGDAKVNDEYEKLRQKNLTPREKLVDEMQKLVNRANELDKQFFNGEISSNQHTRLTGEISKRQKAINQELSDMRDKLLDDKNKPKKSDEQQEAERLEKYYNRILNTAQEDALKAAGKNQMLLPSQIKLQSLVDDSDFLKLSNDKKVKVMEQYVQAYVEEMRAAEIKLAHESHARKLELDAKRAKDLEELLKDFDGTLKQEEEQLRVLQQQNALYRLNSDEKEKIVASDELSMWYAQKKLDIEKKFIEGSVEWYTAREELEIAYAQRRLNLNKTFQEKELQNYIKEFERVASEISEILFVALTEGGAKGAKALRQLIVKELTKPIKLFIEASVKMGMESLGITPQNMMQMFGSGSGGSLLNSVGSLLGISGLGGISSAGIETAMANSAGGYAALTGQTAGMAAAGQSMSAASAAAGPLGSLGPIAGGALATYAMYQMGNRLSGGYSTGLMSERRMNNIGFLLGGGAGTLASGALQRVFGRKLTQVGIGGSYRAGEGFDGYNYTFERGGLLRGNRTRTSEMDGAMESFIGNSIDALLNQVKNFATTLGIGTDALSAFTYEFRMNLKDMSEEDQLKAIQEEFKRMGNAMADMIPGIAEFGRLGEESLDTLKRMAETLGGVNEMFKLLGITLYDTSVDGFKNAEALVNLFGDLSTFTSLTSRYYDTYTSEQDKLANTTKALQEAFARMNIVMPQTREEYAALVSSLDLTTDSGRETWMQLITLSDAFAQITESSSVTTEELRSNITAAFSGRSINEALNSLRDAVTSAVYNRDVLEAAGQLSEAVVTSVYGRTTRATFEQLAAGIQSAIYSAPTEDAANSLRNQLEDVLAGRSTTDSADSLRESIAFALSGNETMMAIAEMQAAMTSVSSGVVDAAVKALNSLTGTAFTQAIEEILNTLAGSISDVLSTVTEGRIEARRAAEEIVTGGEGFGLTFAQIAEQIQTVTSAGLGDMGLDILNFQSIRANMGKNKLAVKRYQDQMRALSETMATTSDPEAYARLKQQMEGIANLINLLGGNIAEAEGQIAASMSSIAEAITGYIPKAEASVKLLNRLREETVNYYKAQKALADGMVEAAKSLKEAISGYGKADDYASLRREFAQNIQAASAIQSAIGTNYASLTEEQIKVLTQSATNIAGAYSSLMDAADGDVIAQASIRTQAQLLADYLEAAGISYGQNAQEQAVELLGLIDDQLAVLEVTLGSAEQMIVEAINATSAKSDQYLLGILNALGGVSSSTKTSTMKTTETVDASVTLADSNRVLASKIDGLSAIMENVEANTRAIAVHAASMSKTLNRVTPEGDALQVRTVV